MIANRRPAVLLLPAMLTDQDLYGPQTEALAARAGFVPRLVAEPSMGRGVAAALRDAPARFAIVGTSFGANLALEIALSAPDRVLGLCLAGCNPGPHGDPIFGRKLGESVRAGRFDAVVDELAVDIVEPSGPNAGTALDSFRAMALHLGAPVFLAQNEALIGRADRWADLGRIACPVQLLWGEEDRFAGVEHGRAMLRAMPQARLLALEACSHLPTLEQPEAITAAIGGWLDRLPAE